MSNMFEDFQDEYQELSKAKIATNIEDLKAALRPLAEDLKAAMNEKAELISQHEARLGEIQSTINSLEAEIRRLWSPFLDNMDKAEMNLGDLKLSTKKVLNVKVMEGCKEQVWQWLYDNGFKDSMKYVMPDPTVKKHARELYEKGVEIPGASYTEFNTISVK